MRDWLAELSTVAVGDGRRFTMEHRLFNTLALLNGVINIYGCVGLLSMGVPRGLILWQLLVGVLFLGFYLYARFRGSFRRLYWPFVTLILLFLLVNALFNAGSMGGAHYYLIAGLIIGVMLGEDVRQKLFAVVLFSVGAGALFAIEQQYPELIKGHEPGARLLDVATNFLFVQAFAGVLVFLLHQALTRERAKSEALLRNVLPEPVADELIATETVEPRAFCASVLFTDFVGFTQLSEKLSPSDLLEKLDQLFSHFDQIVALHQLEKIKTIGDAYMAAGGAPVPNATHPVDAVLAALEIQHYIASLRNTQSAALGLAVRIGVHTGDIVGGIIGRRRFAYDVWGDAVNIAARMESSGEPGVVNVSQSTYQRVEAFFDCEHRGKIYAKNKGEIDMYFVRGLRNEFSRDGSAYLPNDAFAPKYRELAAQPNG